MDRDRMDERRRRSKAGDPPDKAVMGWGSTLVALFIGAAIVGNIMSLRRRLKNFHVYSEGNSARSSARQNPSSQQQGRSQQQRRRSFRDEPAAEARRIYEEHFREIERIRRMQQEALDRERMRNKRNYDSWQERRGDKWDWKWQGTRWDWHGESERVWHEESADDWRRQSQQEWQRTRTNNAEPSRGASNRQHYAALGLDPSRSTPYTEAEIKAAFRAKALEFHPDTNKTNKAEAEKKFHKVMDAYNALKESKSK